MGRQEVALREGCGVRRSERKWQSTTRRPFEDLSGRSCHILGHRKLEPGSQSTVWYMFHNDVSPVIKMKRTKRRKCEQERGDDPVHQPDICVIHFTDSSPENFTYLTRKTRQASRDLQKTTLTSSNVSVPLPRADTLIIQDGNALFHTLQDIPGNFQQIAYTIYDAMPKQNDIVFSTDMYKAQSVKGMERERRGCGDKLIIRGPLTKKPINWKLFLMNDHNKIQLSQVLSDVWSENEFASKLLQHKMVVVVEGHADMLSSDDGNTMKRTEITSLYSTQEETDTRVIIYCLYVQERGYQVVCIRSPDSDVFFIALHHAPTLDVTLLFDTGSGNKKRFINVTDLAHGYGQQFCTAVMALHAFTHCDTTRAFKGIGKIRPIKVLQKMPAFQSVLASLGDELTVPEAVYTELEAFTCAIYRKPRYKKVDNLRYAMLKEKCGSPDRAVNLGRNIDLSQLPPCVTVLHQHIRRVNYQVAIWKRAHVPQPDVPSPADGNGWKVGKGDKLEPVWFEGDALPVDRADVDSDTDTEDSDDSGASDEDEDEGVDDFSQGDDDSDDDDDGT
uniref:uncharacterized protein isoform X1 n=2 Tax=Myxine glutinosa TaxID=7769 RepID=UPI00359026EA